VRETRDGRMQEVEIVLSDWVFQAVEAQEVLTLDRRRFQLAKPLERRLYELARKHVGLQQGLHIGLKKLRLKCGSQSTLREFRRLIQSICDADRAHNHRPGYSFALDGDMVEMQPDRASAPVKQLHCLSMFTRRPSASRREGTFAAWSTNGASGWNANKSLRTARRHTSYRSVNAAGDIRGFGRPGTPEELVQL